jgi:diphthine-ammonia ligase
MTSVAYLWGRNQEELLLEMIQKGMQSILVKVASNGLSERHLGRTIGENFEDFKKAVIC